MAKKHTVAIGVLTPPQLIGQGANALIPGSPIHGTQPVFPSTGVPDPVWLHSDAPVIDVVARLTGKPSATLPRPRYDTVDLPGTTGLNRYRGHDPHEMQLPILLERAGNPVEGDIDKLEAFARRHNASGDEPPVVIVQGVGVPHTDLDWRVTFPEEPDRIEYDSSGRRIRFGLTLTLVEHISDRVLAQTLTGGKRGKGIRHRTATTRKGEDLYSFARRIFGDPSRAADIQRANPFTRFGQVFKADVKLTLP